MDIYVWGVHPEPFGEWASVIVTHLWRIKLREAAPTKGGAAAVDAETRKDQRMKELADREMEKNELVEEAEIISTHITALEGALEKRMTPSS